MRLFGEAPSERAVVHLHVAALKCIRGFGHHPGPASHALDAARDEQIAMIGFDGAPSLIDRFETRAAQAIHRRARNRVGQTGQQRSVARYIA